LSISTAEFLLKVINIGIAPLCVAVAGSSFWCCADGAERRPRAGSARQAAYRERHEPQRFIASCRCALAISGALT